MFLPFQLGGGYLFGLPIGFLADSIGAVIGATAAFLLGRTVSFMFIIIFLNQVVFIACHDCNLVSLKFLCRLGDRMLFPSWRITHSFKLLQLLLRNLDLRYFDSIFIWWVGLA